MFGDELVLRRDLVGAVAVAHDRRVFKFGACGRVPGSIPAMSLVGLTMAMYSFAM